MTRPSAVPDSDSRMTMWPPWTTRLKTSRPSWSTPKGCAQLMPDSGRPGAHLRKAVGRPERAGGRHDEMQEQDDSADAEAQRRLPPQRAQSRPRRWRRRQLGRSLMAQPVLRRGIEQDGADVGEQIGRDIDQRRDQDRRLDQRQIAELQRIDQQAAEAGIAEHLLHHHDAADQIGEIERRDVERRHQRVGQRMAQQHAAGAAGPSARPCGHSRNPAPRSDCRAACARHRPP